jgi:hypothetical protein
VDGSSAALGTVTGRAVQGLADSIEQVGVGAGPDQVEFVALDFVNEHPVRLDVAIAKMLPVSGEWMVFKSARAADRPRSRVESPGGA